MVRILTLLMLLFLIVGKMNSLITCFVLVVACSLTHAGGKFGGGGGGEPRFVSPLSLYFIEVLKFLHYLS